MSVIEINLFYILLHDYKPWTDIIIIIKKGLIYHVVLYH